MKALVLQQEYGPEIQRLWSDVLPPESAVVEMTAFGDLVIQTPLSVLLLSLSWLSLSEIATVIEEVHWQLQDPSGRDAGWVYPHLLQQLPSRTSGHIYHFVHPLGLSGHMSSSNIQLLPIQEAHSGMRKLWSQVNAAQPAVQADGPAFGGSAA